LQLLADGLGRDPRERQRGLELRIGLALGIDEAANLFFDCRAAFFGRFASAKVVGVEAANAGAEFVESGLDGSASPAENGLGAAGRAATVFIGDFGLESPTPIACE